VAEHGSGRDGLGKGAQSGPGGCEQTPGTPPGIGGVGLDADDPLHRLEGIPEEEAGALQSAEEIGDRLEAGALHVLEEKRGRSRLVGPALDFRHLEERIDLLAHAHQVPVALEVQEGLPQASVAHSSSGILQWRR
jgi:hypothetical protein